MIDWVFQMGPIEKLHDRQGYTPLHFACYNGKISSKITVKMPKIRTPKKYTVITLKFE